MTKADFLQECMSEFKGAPIDAFSREFCMLCSNRECLRSWANTSVFDARVKNWRTALFDNVPRSNNPNLANPKFQPVEFGRTPDVEFGRTPDTIIPVFETIPAAPPLSYEDVADTEPGNSESIRVAPVPVIPTIQAPGSVNTPFNEPVTIGNPQQIEEKAEPGCVFVFEDE